MNQAQIVAVRRAVQLATGLDSAVSKADEILNKDKANTAAAQEVLKSVQGFGTCAAEWLSAAMNDKNYPKE